MTKVMPGRVLDTRTEHYCNPLPDDGLGFRPANLPAPLPYCSNLAKQWW
jgi:hypothetical protein